MGFLFVRINIFETTCITSDKLTSIFTIWHNMTRLTTYTLLPSSVWCVIEGITSAVKILVQLTFFMLRFVFSLALGLFSLHLIFSVYISWFLTHNS